MKKNKKNKRTIITLILCIIVLIMFSTIAYSAFSSTMNIKGIAYSRVEADVRITDFSIYESNNATSSYEEFSKNTVASEIDLPVNSSITYSIEITNYSSYSVGINSISGLPEGLDMQISNYTLQEPICNSEGKCNTLVTKTILLTISSDNDFKNNLNLEFEFKMIHSITYKNFTGTYKKGAMDGQTISIDLSTDSPKFVNLISKNSLSYTYKNNIITINNVTCDIELEAINTDIIENYSYTGTYQLFTVPYTGLYKVQLWGATGGYSRIDGAAGQTGGRGGYTEGTIQLYKDEKVYIYVGSKGADAVVGKNNAGGYNGGGTGTWDNNDNESAGGGGGATDIRIFESTPTSNDLLWNSTLGIKARIMVAAGGGGTAWKTQGGAGGGLKGVSNNPTANPGTQTTGYALGIGQSGSGAGVGSDGIAGAGGGYYGGYADGTTYGYETGAGGSSYISGHDGCNATDNNGYHSGHSLHKSNRYFTDTIMIDGLGYKWTNIKTTTTTYPTNSDTKGNGYAKITLINIENKSLSTIENEKVNIIKNSYYEYDKSYQLFTVPYSGIYKVELWGAGGNYGLTNASKVHAPGYGGYASGEILLTKGEKLYVYVGGQGGYTTNGKTGGSTGYNGGGKGGSDNNETEKCDPGGGGGGATDIRYATNTLYSRIMVAGGGGGSAFDGAGGYGGGISGGTGNITTILGGKQISGYSFGIGANGIDNAAGTGGGGGGYWGGNTGTATDESGAGGSAYISGHTGCVAIASSTSTTPRNNALGQKCTEGTTDTTCSYHYSGKVFSNTTTIPGNSTMPTHDGTSTMTGNSGNGYAKITLLELK